MRSYRNVGLTEGITSLEQVWNRAIASTPDVWERVSFHDGRMVFSDGTPGRPEEGRVELGSFLAQDLPPLVGELPLLGRMLLRTSTFVNILARRRGTEEVTFYVLNDCPHGRTRWERWVDRQVLKIGGPPMAWRRERVVAGVRGIAFGWLRQAQENGNLASVQVVDIGSGGGFDGLDLVRLFEALGEEAVTALRLPRLRVINVDLDARWLDNNRRLRERANWNAVPGCETINRAASVFEYVESGLWREDLDPKAETLVLCNGFSEFLPDEQFERLLKALHTLAVGVRGRAVLLLVVAGVNPRLQRMSEWVGFGYYGRAPEAVQAMVRRCLPSLGLVATEGKFSQWVFKLAKEVDTARPD